MNIEDDISSPPYKFDIYVPNYIFFLSIRFGLV